MKTHIVAIGGGRETLPIDREIVRLSGKKHPKLLFIPTASDDDPRYSEYMRKLYGARLKCLFDELLLFRARPSAADIRKKIASADIIYVGGGNTLRMMRLWRRLGVDRLLKAAYKKGTVMCGVSAGSICWFASGHSDSMSFYNPKQWKYVNVRGLGCIPAIHCPHFDSKTLGIPRRKNFERMIGKIGGTGIAVEDNCALHVMDGREYRVLRSKPYAKAYRVSRRKGEVVSEAVPISKKPLPLAEIL